MNANITSFLCYTLWTKIQITNLNTAVIDTNKKSIIMEAGYDSRDEYNRLIDIWEYKAPSDK